MITAPSTMSPKSIAQTHQVSADVTLNHADRRHEHRERDGERADQRRSKIAEKDEQHDDDERRAFSEVLRDRVDRRVDELGAVQAPSVHDSPAAESD
jgi:hypothetical protein